jgi:hypothetical protein
MLNWVLVVVLLSPGSNNGPIKDYQVVEHYRTKQDCVSAKQPNTTARQYVCLPVDKN